MDKDKIIALVCALQKGDDTAATTIYDAFYSDIYYYILKTVKDPELAADLTQDTFIEILETIGKLRVPAAFVPWSKKIAYHKCTAYFRKSKDLLADELEDGYSLLDLKTNENREFIPDETIDQTELKQTIWNMLDALPKEQRDAIIMRYYDEISIKDIAKIQNTSEGTIKSRLNYGRTAIRQSVEAYEKKYDVRLHCVGIIPVLLWLFREERRAKGLSLTQMTPTAEAIAALLNKSAGTLAKKISAAVIAVLFLAGGTTTAIHTNKAETPSPSESPSSSESLASNVESENPYYENSQETMTPDSNGNHTQDESETDVPDSNLQETDTENAVSNEDDSDIKFPQNNGESESTGTETETEIETAPSDSTLQEMNPYCLTFTLSDDESHYIISDIDTETYLGSEVTIPAEYNGIPVTTIGEYAFRNSEYLTSIILPDSITTIENNAFYDCPRLISMTIPKNVTSIAPRAICNNNALTELIVSKDNPVYHSDGNCIIETASKTLIVGCRNSIIPSDGSVRSIGNGAFAKCTTLTNITIPSTIITIGEGAFSASGLTEVTIPNSVLNIRNSAFRACPDLTDVTIPEGVINIEYFAFLNCTSLTKIVIPASVTTIGFGVFSGCNNLKTITVSENNSVYHSDGNCIIATEQKKLISGCSTSIIPGDGSVTSIGSYAIAEFNNITSISIPANITTIHHYAFYHLSKLTSITIPESVSTIGYLILVNTSLTDIYYTGTIAQWNSINIDRDLGPRPGTYTIHCTDGDIIVEN